MTAGGAKEEFGAEAGANPDRNSQSPAIDEIRPAAIDGAIFCERLRKCVADTPESCRGGSLHGAGGRAAIRESA